MGEEQPGDGRLRLAELVAALSLATDLGMGQPMEWALRACLLGVRLGQALGMAEDELRDVFYLALLRFVGCTAEAHQDALVYSDELAIGAQAAMIDFGNPSELVPFMLRNIGANRSPLRRARLLAATLIAGPRAAMAATLTHCEVAARLAERLGFGAGVQAALWQMFERWDGQGMPKRLKGEAIALPVRVVQLAHHADPFYQRGGAADAVAMARRRAGRAYDPVVVERFCREAPGLFAGLESESIWETTLAAEPGQRAWVAESQLDDACRALADFADLKSPYTVGHSSGVAELAYAAARRCGLPESDAVAVRRAGLLHDLGRVGVSAGIWGKPGPLTPGEWERVRLHPYLTERILARAPALAQLGALAALHHERLDGSGYYRSLPGSLQSPAARLLAVADAYHAMTEARPHRLALTPAAAAEELRREVQAGRLAADAAEAVLGAAGHQLRPVRTARVGGLSAREVEVLRLVARGLSNREMALRLAISQKTVDHHIQHIYDKIGVSTRAAATLFAMQHDLLGDQI